MEVLFSFGFPLFIFYRMRVQQNRFSPEMMRHYGYFFAGSLRGREGCGFFKLWEEPRPRVLLQGPGQHRISMQLAKNIVWKTCSGSARTEVYIVA